MHREWYDVPEATAAAVNRALDEGRRVVAVGTTITRVLEHGAAHGRLLRGERLDGPVHPARARVPGSRGPAHQLPPPRVHAAGAGVRVRRHRPRARRLPPCRAGRVPLLLLRRCDVGAMRGDEVDAPGPGKADTVPVSGGAFRPRLRPARPRPVQGPAGDGCACSTAAVETPAFMPVGTQATVKAMTPEEVPGARGRDDPGQHLPPLSPPGPRADRGTWGVCTAS